MIKRFLGHARLLLTAALIACVSSAGYSAQESELVLNGKGTRQAVFVDLYTCELYLPAKTRDEMQIVPLKGRVTVKLQVHGAPPTPIPDDWYKVLKGELSDVLFQRMHNRYRDLEEGDRIELVFQPELGTLVLVNDEEVLFDPGEGLMTSVLKQWIGGEPVSEKLKRELLDVQ